MSGRYGVPGWDEPEDDEDYDMRDDDPEAEDDEPDYGCRFDVDPEWAEMLTAAEYAEFVEWQYDRPDAQPMGPR